jgi:hypothetical protein
MRLGGNTTLPPLLPLGAYPRLLLRCLMKSSNAQATHYYIEIFLPMHTDKNYFVLSEREFSLNKAGLCVCCHSANVEPIIDYDIDIDPESGLCSASIFQCGWEYACESCKEALDEADIILWDKPELPPVVLPFHMSVMLMASTECGQVNDALPF